jgi:MoxR-like ATPase
MSVTTTLTLFRGQGTVEGAIDQLANAGRARTYEIDPVSYVANPALVDAVNVALLLDQPLLLTGEPGTGKTQLAYRVAYEYGLEKPLRFDTKSTSQARDLFYSYDALGRFQASDHGGSRDAVAYVHFGPLGMAALLASGDLDTRRLLPPGLVAAQPRRSVVLIDEIDKAPRDFPNDILNEIEHFSFRVAELENREILAPRYLRPIVIITSNSEKDLPDAFLRRCVFHHIRFPAPADLRRIVEGRLGSQIVQDDFLRDAIRLFYDLREGQLRKKPATAELLGWLIALRRFAPDVQNPLADPRAFDGTISAVVKTVEDEDEARRIYKQWAKAR